MGSWKAGVTLTLVLLAGAIRGEGDVDVPEGLGAENSGRDCIALTVFSEARGESWLGQALVVQVIKNRMREAGWPSDPCAVVHQMHQFHGIRDWPFPRDPVAIDARAWDLALRITDDVMLGRFDIAPPACAEATYFFRADMRPPSWSLSLQEVCEVGAHVFLATAEAAARADRLASF